MSIRTYLVAAATLAATALPGAAFVSASASATSSPAPVVTAHPAPVYASAVPSTVKPVPYPFPPVRPVPITTQPTVPSR